MGGRGRDELQEPRLASPLTTRAESAGVRIAVQDTGIGLSSEEQQQFFTKFFRAQPPLVRDAGALVWGWLLPAR